MTFPRLAVALVFALSSFTAHAAAPSAPLKLDSSRLSIAVDPASGVLLSLRDPATGRDWLAPQKSPELFQLEFSERSDPSGKRFTLSSREAQNVTLQRDPAAAGARLRWTFSDLARRDIHVTCTAAAAPNDLHLRWRLEARFPEALILESVRFPSLVLRVPTGDDASDALVLGNTKGGVRRQWAKRKPGSGFSAMQPGSLAAQFGCYYDDAGGLMTAAFDPRGYRKTLAATRTAEGLLVQWQHACFASSRFAHDYDLVCTAFSSPDAQRPTDWRDAADLYKQWAVQQAWCRRTFAARDDLPAWLRNGPAMVRFGRQWLAQPETIERWFTDFWKPNFGTDVPLVIAYWGWEKVSTWITPDYFPVYPSDEQFRRLAQLGRQVNGHAFLWPSGYHYTLTYDKQPDGSFVWDDRARFDATARPHAVHTRDGKLYLGDCSWLKGGQNSAMCAGDPWTIDWLNRIAVGCAERGAELVQVDQVVGGNWPVCFSAEHGHAPGPGCWSTDVFRRQLQTMLAACRRLQPDAVVCFEEPNEHFIQEIGLQDYRDWEVLKKPGTDPASVFGYLYHEYLPAFQSNPRAGDRLLGAYCLANGQIPHLVPSMLRGPETLLLNGQFTLPLAVAGWGKVAGYKGRVYSGQADLDAATGHGDSVSLRLTNTEKDQIVQVAQNVAVGRNFAIGGKYRLRAWIKTQGLRQTNHISLAALGHEMHSAGSWRIPLPPAAAEWTQGEVQFTLPAGTDFLRIMLNVHGPGTVWVDDLALEAIDADGQASPVMRPDKPDDFEFMRQWVTLFHGEGRPYLLLGKMLHPPRLETATFDARGCRFPAVLHNAFEAADGTQAVVLVNATDAPQSARLSWKGTVRDLTFRPWEAQLAR